MNFLPETDLILCECLLFPPSDITLPPLPWYAARRSFKIDLKVGPGAVLERICGVCGTGFKSGLNPEMPFNYASALSPCSRLEIKRWATGAKSVV